MQGSYCPKKMSPVYAPRRKDTVQEARQAKMDISAARGSEPNYWSQLLLRELAKGGLAPDPTQNDYTSLGAGPNLFFRKYGAAGVCAMFALFPFLAGIEGQEAKGQSDDLPEPQKVFESLGIVKELKVSPYKSKIVFSEGMAGTGGGRVVEYDVDSAEARTVYEDENPDDNVDGNIILGPVYDEGGDLLYAVAHKDGEGNISSDIREANEQGERIVVAGEGAIAPVAKSAGRLLYTAEDQNAHSGKGGSLYIKQEGQNPVALISKDCIRYVKASEGITRIGVAMCSYSSSGGYKDAGWKIIDSQGRLLKYFSQYPDSFGFGFGKLVYARTTSNEPTHIFISEEDGSGEVMLEDAHTVGVSDIQWVDGTHISFVNGLAFGGFSVGDIVKRRTDTSGTDEVVVRGPLTNHVWIENKLFYGADGLYLVDFANFNHGPELRRASPSSAGDREAIVGKRFYMDFDGLDKDGDELTFSDNTTSFQINPQTGEIAWTPTDRDLGRHDVKVCVSDGKASDCEVIGIRVSLPRQKFSLPFTDNFDEQQRQGQDGSDKWNVLSGTKIIDGKYRIGRVLVGKGELDAYMFSMEFAGSSLPSGSGFYLSYGERPLETLEFNKNGSTLNITGYPLSKTAMPNPVQVDDKAHKVDLAVSGTGFIRLYYDGKQILKFPTAGIEKNRMEIAGNGLLIDNVTIRRWDNSPPSVRALPRELTLTRGEFTTFKPSLYDPDGDNVTAHFYTPKNLAKIEKSGTTFRIKPNSTALKKLLFDVNDDEYASEVYEIPVKVVEPQKSSGAAGIASLILIAAGTAIGGAVGALGYYARRRIRSRESRRAPAAQYASPRPAAWQQPSTSVPQGAQFSAIAKAYQPPLHMEDGIPLLELEDEPPMHIPLQRHELTTEQLRNILTNSGSREEAIRIMHLASGKLEKEISSALTEENYRRLKGAIERGNL